MKTRNLLLPVALFALGAPLCISSAQAQPENQNWAALPSQDKNFASVQAKLREKSYDEALKEAQAVLQEPILSPNDKVRFFKAATTASLNLTPPDRNGASALAEKIIADPLVPNTAKIEALEGLADIYISTLAGQNLDQMDLGPAHAALNRALELPNLTPEDRALALTKKANLLTRDDQYEQASALYQQIEGLDVRDTVKTQAKRQYANSLAQLGRTNEAIEIYKQNNFNLYPLYRQLGLNDLAIQEIKKVLEDQSILERERYNAYNQLPVWNRQLAETYFPKFVEADPTRALSFVGKYRNTQLTSKTSASDIEFLEWGGPILLQAPKLSDSDYVIVNTRYIDALATRGKIAAAVEHARSITNDQRLPATKQFWATLVVSGVASKDGTEAVKLITANKALPESERASAVLDATRTVLRAGNTAAAQNLYKAYEGLFVQRPVATITCNFSEKAPFDVTDWLNSPIRKDPKSSAKLDRPYGDNLDFLLLTDSATTGRQAGSTKESTGDSNTDFHVAADDEGIHFFLYAYDNRAQESVNKLIGGGSFEMYLAPGDHQAYMTFLANLPKGDIDVSFNTMYPNAQFRWPSIENGTMRTSSRFLGNGFGTSFFLSWQLFYDKLPSNGDKWKFDSIRWTRSGGLSFGGSESVHNRSMWGDIVFNNMTPQNVNSIKRAIIYQAVDKYKKAKAITKPVGNWADNELGDPAFHHAKVLPLLTSLDSYVSRVTKDMTAAGVDEIFEKAVPDWMELEFKVAEMRSRYLQEQMMSK
jgi:tetratricopeptide (TPR) repeat protein